MAGRSFRDNVKQNKKASESGSQLIPLEAGQPVTLALDNRVGSANIHGGASGEIRVDYVKTAYAETMAKATEKLGQIKINIAQDGDRVRVYTTDDTPRDSSQSNKVDFEITVPDTINLIIKLDVGDVQVEDIQAPDTLRVEAKVGEITVSDVGAPGGLKLSAVTGKIDFEGTLAGDGDISAKTGPIHVELPPDAAARVNAQTKIGSVTVSGFDVHNVQNERQMVSERWRGTLGSGSEPPTLRLQTDVGDITIERS